VIQASEEIVGSYNTGLAKVWVAIRAICAVQTLLDSEGSDDTELQWFSLHPMQLIQAIQESNRHYQSQTYIRELPEQQIFQI